MINVLSFKEAGECSFLIQMATPWHGAKESHETWAAPCLKTGTDSQPTSDTENCREIQTCGGTQLRAKNPLKTKVS